MTSYDEIIYPSYSHSSTNPAKSCAIGKLLGVNTVSVGKARILEIGCASGANIIPLAEIYPNATILGVDLSANQIALAEDKKNKLGLKNITFKADSILDVDLSGQEFDYIIAHGVYAWVPDYVQKCLLKICGTCLSPNGIAFISYNTLPGWNSIKTIRDMMLFHGETFSDPMQKVREGRNVLAFVAKNVQPTEGPYKQILEKEINRIQDVSDSYLFHEYLEALNKPCYFREFMASANEFGLSYLAESNLPSMYLGNQNSDAAKVLGGIADLVRQEQYVDFITNRRFRSTLLMRDTVTFSRALDGDRLKGIKLTANFFAEEPVDEESLENLAELNLVARQEKGLSTKISGHIQCLAYFELLKVYPGRLTVSEITKAVLKTSGDVSMKANDLEKILANFFIRLVFKGLVSISMPDVLHASEAGEKPNILPSIRLAAEEGENVTNVYHDSVQLRRDQRIVIQFMDGTKDIDALVDVVSMYADQNELTFNVDKKLISAGDAGYRDVVKQYIESQINIFENNAFFM